VVELFDERRRRLILGEDRNAGHDGQSNRSSHDRFVKLHRLLLRVKAATGIAVGRSASLGSAHGEIELDRSPIPLTERIGVHEGIPSELVIASCDTAALIARGARWPTVQDRHSKGQAQSVFNRTSTRASTGCSKPRIRWPWSKAS